MLSSEREPQAIGRSLLGPRSQRVPAGPAVRPFCVCAKEKIAAAPCVLFCVCALRRSAKIQAQRHPASSRPLCEPGLDFAPAQSPGRSTRSLQSLHYRAWSPASLPPNQGERISNPNCSYFYTSKFEVYSTPQNLRPADARRSAGDLDLVTIESA